MGAVGKNWLAVGEEKRTETGRRQVIYYKGQVCGGNAGLSRRDRDREGGVSCCQDEPVFHAYYLREDDDKATCL